MTRSVIFLLVSIFFTAGAAAQTREPSRPDKPFVIRSDQQIFDLSKELQSQQGNKQSDIVAAVGTQMRVAVFHDEKRENDLIEVHDSSDDIYYVLDGEATLMLGGELVDPIETAAGEWRSKTASGGQKVVIKKGDLVVVPRGTPHQRTVAGKGLSMILIKVFANRQ